VWATQKNEKVNAMRAAHSLPIALHRVCRFYRILTDLFANNRELHSVFALPRLRVRPLRAAAAVAWPLRTAVLLALFVNTRGKGHALMHRDRPCN